MPEMYKSEAGVKHAYDKMQKKTTKAVAKSRREARQFPSAAKALKRSFKRELKSVYRAIKKEPFHLEKDVYIHAPYVEYITAHLRANGYTVTPAVGGYRVSWAPQAEK
jgi:hypothetical protein